MIDNESETSPENADDIKEVRSIEPKTSHNESGLSPELLEIDNQFARKTEKLLRDHDLLPDGKTFYLCDTGIRHGVRIADALREYGVASRTVIDENISGPIHVEQYYNGVKAYGEPRDLPNAKGEMVIVDGHNSYTDEGFGAIETQMPSADELQKKGYERLVMLSEARIVGDVQGLEGDFLAYDTAIKRYLRGLGEAGVEVLAVGVEPRSHERLEMRRPRQSIAKASWMDNRLDETYEKKIPDKLMDSIKDMGLRWVDKKKRKSNS